MSEEEVPNEWNLMQPPVPEDADACVDQYEPEDLSEQIWAINEAAEERNIHPVCAMCVHDCKKPYSWWSFQMPPWMFCEDWEGDEE